MTLQIEDFDKQIIPQRRKHLQHSFFQATQEGQVLEFGVFRGKSLRLLAKLAGEREVFGFDSFIGLPEDWKRSKTDTYKKGHFATPIPDLPDNATLIKGFFEDTLPHWVETHQKPVSFLHIDCDLYSSTVTILTHLNRLIVPGTIIVFDELCDWTEKQIYPSWEEGEWKALNEWIQDNERKVEPLSRTTDFSATIRVLQ